MKLETLKIVTLLGAVTASVAGGLAPSEPGRVEDAFGHVMETLLEEGSGIYMGMDLDDLEEATAGAADNDGTRYARLGDTRFDPPGEHDGLVEVSTVNAYGEDEVDQLSVIFFHGEDDLAKLTAALQGAARSLDLELHPHEELPNCWDIYEVDHPDDMWTIALGDSVVIFEAWRIALEEGEEWEDW